LVGAKFDAGGAVAGGVESLQVGFVSGLWIWVGGMVGRRVGVWKGCGSWSQGELLRVVVRMRGWLVTCFKL
jgi:hypothetical protein